MLPGSASAASRSSPAAGRPILRRTTRTAAIRFTWRLAQVGGRPAGPLSGQTTIRRLDYDIGQGKWRSTEGIGNTMTIHYALEPVPSG